MDILHLFWIVYLIIVSRMTGGLPPDIPLKGAQILFGFPYGVVVYYATGFWWLAALCWAWAALVKSSGHGQYMALPFSIKAVAPERIDPLVTLVWGKDPRTDEGFAHMRGRWPDKFEQETLLASISQYGEWKLADRNVWGLAIKAIIMCLPTVIAVSFSSFLVGLIILSLHAFFVGRGYRLGHAMFADIEPPFGLSSGGTYATEWGEIIRGVVCGLSISLALIILTSS